MRARKKIAFFTFIRSEYGSLRFLLKAIETQNQFDYELLVGGAHLEEGFGYTLTEIEGDNQPVSAKIKFLLPGDDPASLGEGLAVLTKGVNGYLAAADPDLIFLLGDRFELLPIATLALIYRIPVAHISGGEITEGAIDNQVRHALSKISNIHFVSTDNAKRNLVTMGECPSSIHVTGELGLETIMEMTYSQRQDFCSNLEIGSDKQIIAVTFHPETAGDKISADFIYNLFKTLAKEKPGYQVVATAANFDNGGAEINQALKRLSSEIKDFYFFESLGKKKYYNLLKHSVLVLGNSSSGIYEAQSFNIPVINVGDRQKGRYANPNVYDVKAGIPEIMDAFEFVQSDIFGTRYINKPNVYANGSASERIVEILSEMEWTSLANKKNCLGDYLS